MPRRAANFVDGVPRYKNITVDADIVDLLGTKADELCVQFGFRPTISQTLRHIINKERGQ